MDVQENEKIGNAKLKDSIRKGLEPVCIVCGETAEFCMRGIPKNTYCRECAEHYFQLLEYLDKMQ